MLGAQSIVNQVLSLMAESQTATQFEVPKRTSMVIVHNRTEHTLVANLEIESKATGKVHAGTAQRLEFAAGTCLACISLPPNEDLRVTAGDEEVGVQVRSVVLVPR